MKLYTSEYLSEILACDELYLVNTRTRYTDKVEVLKDSILDNPVLVTHTGDNILEASIVNDDYTKYEYKQILLCNSRSNEVKARIDLETTENIKCITLSFKITIKEKKVTVDSIFDFTKESFIATPSSPYGYINTFQGELINIFTEKTDAYDNNYVVKGDDLYEVPFTFLVLESNIKRIYPIHKNSYLHFLFIETKYKYLVDFDKKLIFTTNPSRTIFNEYIHILVEDINMSYITKDGYTYDLLTSEYELIIEHNKYSIRGNLNQVLREEFLQLLNNSVTYCYDKDELDLVVFNNNYDFYKLTNINLTEVRKKLELLIPSNYIMKEHVIINGNYFLKLEITRDNNTKYYKLFIQLLGALSKVVDCTKDLSIIPISKDKVFINTTTPLENYGAGYLTTDKNKFIKLFGRKYIITDNTLILSYEN